MNSTVSTNYIPRSIIFDPAGTIGVKISPDGKYLAQIKGDSAGVMNIYLCPINKCHESSALQQMTNFTIPEIYRFFWTEDSKHLVFLYDTTGSKSYQIYSLNIVNGKIFNHTDNKKISGKIYRISGSKVAVGINDRNAQFHDLYILDTNDGALTKVLENDRFSRFTFDENLKLVFAEEVHDDGSIDVYRDNKVYMHFSAEDAFDSELLTIYKNTLYYLDCRGSNTNSLKAIDLSNGKETKIANNAKSDIADVTFVAGKPFLYSTNWLLKEWHSLGADVFAPLYKELGTSFYITSYSNNLWVIRYTEPKSIGVSFYIYNSDNGQLIPISEAKKNPDLAAMHPFEFMTRDGLLLTAYVTLHNKYKSIEEIKKPIPLIIIPHGGPFKARDIWCFDAAHQWLASRGYAVLSVNFRLSSGLGKNLVNAGNGEWGRKAQYDLIDAANWCIERGITSKEQVGIFGGSYGGYATLAGLAFTPTEFAVGVDVVGPSSLITVLEKLPQFWDWPEYPLADTELFFTKGAFIKSMGGNPADPKGREFLATRSPVNYAQQIIKPLLIVQGDNDPIVTKQESEQIFAELKRLQKHACLLSFPDEGHHITRQANVDVYLAYVEKWLHDTLGGSFEPIDTELLKQSSVVIQNSSKG